jgi:DNA polymerase sigma
LEYANQRTLEILLTGYTATLMSFSDNVLFHVQGGVVEKKREWKQAERPWLLAVEDPQQLGKDIGSGSFNIRNVQQLFAAAASTLRDCPEHQTEQDQWASVQVC